MKFPKSKHVVVKAKTKESAVEEALKQLGATPDQIELQILEEPRKGLFGLFAREAKVLATCPRSPVEKAEIFLSGCIEKMGFDTEIEILPGPNAHAKLVNLKGEDLGILIGKKGRTIESLQYLVNLVANQDAKEPIRFILDAGGYRKRREETLIQLAKRTASKVKRGQKSIKLDPMPAIERKIIHTVLQDDPEILTQSEGVDPHRSIVVKPQKL